MSKKKIWFSYRELTSSKHSIKWKIYLNDYIKNHKGWKTCKPKDFDYRLNNVGNHCEVAEVRNVSILSNVFSL